MNLREGMRRVGIVLGALGCVAGGIFGYSNLQSVWRSHKRFERLQTLPVMVDVNTALKLYRETHDLIPAQQESRRKTLPTEHGPWENYGPGPNPDSHSVGNETVESLAAKAREKSPACQFVGDAELVRSLIKKWPVYRTWLSPEEQEKLREPDFIPDYAVRASDLYDKAAADDSDAETTVDVQGTAGIQTVNADKAGAISSIRLTSGEWVRRGPNTLKARLAFIGGLLLPFCYPVIGFVVPWGTIRVFVWIAGGFAAPPR
jgi:hypothetical protein